MTERGSPTILAVANETLGGSALIEAVRRRSEETGARVVVICPQNQPKRGWVVYDDSVRAAAENRLETTLAQLRQVGIEATGEIVDPDPYSAIMDAVSEYSPAELVISTHPETRSGWLRRDLVDRVRQSTGLPVEHVVVDLDVEREDVTHTLVVANQTVGGEPLIGLLTGKAKEKPHRFTVICPQSGDEDSPSHERLAHTLRRLEEEGLEAVGQVMDPDPFTAVQNALQFYAVDEIVISTFPATRSGWIRSDLVERVRASTSKPVEHVVVSTEEAEEKTEEAVESEEAAKP